MVFAKVVDSEPDLHPELLRMSWEFDHPVYICFVDLEANNCVIEGFCMGCGRSMGKYGVGEVCGLFVPCTTKARAVVTVTVGLCQGCSLLLILFGIFMYRISRHRERRVSRLGTSVLHLYSLADEVVQLASSNRNLQHTLGQFAAECEVAGMKLSSSKSEAVILNQKKVECSRRVRNESLPRSLTISGSC